MKKFGESYSTRSKQCRMKRIDVNVKINVLAYSVEMLGGLLLVALSLLRPPTFLYIGTEIWYGNVIPSCYLLNSSDTKAFVIEQGWVLALLNLYKKSKPTTHSSLKNKKNIAAKNKVDDISQASKSDSASTRFQSEHSNGRKCAKKVKEDGTSGDFRKDTKSGGRKNSIRFGKLSHSSVHPSTHIFPTKKGQLGTPINSRASVNHASRLTIEKDLSSRDIYQDPRPGPSKEVILGDLDGIIERNTKDEVVEKCVHISQQSEISHGNQTYFYQAPSIFYIHHKGNDACDSVKFQDGDMKVRLPNQA